MVKKNGRKLVLTLNEQSVKLSEREKAVEQVDDKVIASLPLTTPVLWLRIDADFNVGRDMAQFYYSTDVEQWTQLGGDYKLRFDWQRFFMGSKFAIFNYATKRLGGYIDVDCFNYSVTEK